MSLITYSEFRGDPAPDFLQAHRLTIIRLDCPLEVTNREYDQLSQRLIEQQFNVLMPRMASWWFNRSEKSVDELLQFVASTELKRIALFGGEAAVRLALSFPDRFPIAATWDGWMDFHELHGQGTELDHIFERKEQARQETATLQVRPNSVPNAIWFGCPEDSPRFRGHDRLHEKLNAVGVSHHFAIAPQLPIDELINFFVFQENKRQYSLL